MIELALVLATLGFLILIAPTLKGSVSTMQVVDPAGNPVQRGADALAGFVVMYDRLPCPDTAGSGMENCGGAKYGGFPWKTVGLAQPLQNAHGLDLKYGVYRDAAADLAANTSAYIPSFLNSPAAPTPYSVNINGLDFCENLRTAGRAAYSGAEVGVKVVTAPGSAVNPAFLLADPGNTDANNAGGMFDGVNNTGLVWESPALPKTPIYDDQVYALSFYQLAARLDCPAIIARVSGAVRDANAAYDIKRTHDFLKKYRDYNVNVRSASKDLAYTMDIIADFDLAITAAMAVTDIAITLSSASGAVAGAIAIANGVIAISMSVAGKFGLPPGAACPPGGAVSPGSACIYTMAQADLVTAQAQAASAAIAVTAANTALTAAVAEAQNRDAKGWFQ